MGALRVPFLQLFRLWRVYRRFSYKSFLRTFRHTGLPASDSSCICIRFSGFKPRKLPLRTQNSGRNGAVFYRMQLSRTWRFCLLLRSKDSRHLSVLRKRKNRRRSGQRRDLPPAYPGARINRNRYFSDHCSTSLPASDHTALPAEMAAPLSERSLCSFRQTPRPVERGTRSL